MGPHSKSLYSFQVHEALGSFTPTPTPHHPPPPPGWDAICSPSQLCSLQYTTSKHKIKDLCRDGNKKIVSCLRKSSDRTERAQISPTLIQSLQPCQPVVIHISTTSLQFCSWISQKERDCYQLSQVRWPVASVWHDWGPLSRCESNMIVRKCGWTFTFTSGLSLRFQVAG